MHRKKTPSSGILLCDRSWIAQPTPWTGGRQSGGLHFWGLHLSDQFWISLTTHWTGGLHIASLEPILDLATHSLDWVSTLWGVHFGGLRWTGGLHTSGLHYECLHSDDRFWMFPPTHWTGGLHPKSLHFWGPHSSNRFCISPPTHWTGVLHSGVYTLGVYFRATDLGSRHPLIGLGVYTLLGGYILGVYTRATDFGSHHPLIGLVGVNTPGVYTFEGVRSSDRCWISPHRK